MEIKEALGYRYDKSTIQNYGFSKIYEVVSKKLGMKYLGSTTNSLENILHNYILDKKKYDEDGYGFNEVYLLLDSDDVEINLVSLEYCSGKRELDLKATKYLRDHRVEYINILLHQRLAGEFKADIIGGVEDKFIARYKDRLMCDKFEKYLKQVECARTALKPSDLAKCLAK
jgi:hypothetical protein